MTFFLSSYFLFERLIKTHNFFLSSQRIVLSTTDFLSQGKMSEIESGFRSSGQRSFGKAWRGANASKEHVRPMGLTRLLQWGSFCANYHGSQINPSKPCPAQVCEEYLHQILKKKCNKNIDTVKIQNKLMFKNYYFFLLISFKHLIITFFKFNKYFVIFKEIFFIVRISVLR